MLVVWLLLLLSAGGVLGFQPLSAHRAGRRARLQSQERTLTRFQSTSTGQEDEPPSVLTKAQDTIGRVISGNPLFRGFATTYEFFYWFPRKNLPYDQPWRLFKNSSAEWLAWYQLPHNLPPYDYLGTDHPADFFCFGLIGNTLPLGNWDPWGFQLVQKKVVRRYRESELKHGRLAMMAV
ncbi:hypothetical protein B484DRAFT_403444, partial [Ochromonadaceae sp. CCMP2298]